MAARKSCTHLTWAEAKAKVGGSTGTKKKSLIPKKIDHGKALTLKVIAKNGASQSEISKEKTLLRKAKRDEERALAAIEKRKEEKELKRIQNLVKPFDLAVDRIKSLAKKIQQQDLNRSESFENEIDDIKGLQNIAECRSLQLNEVMGLEAIYADTDNFYISNSSQFETLQGYIEEWQMDVENESMLQSILQHPPLSFTIQVIVDGMCKESNMEIAAVLLLRVIMPKMYPIDETSIPNFVIEDFIATDREALCNPDKPLESLAHLAENRLKNTLEEEARLLLPDPCVYEVVTSSLMERLFDFLTMSVHAQYA